MTTADSVAQKHKGNDVSASDTHSSSKESTVSSNGKLDREHSRMSRFSAVDWVLILVGILVLFLCLAGGLIGYFVLEKGNYDAQVASFEQGGKTVIATIDKNIKLALNDLLVIQQFLQLFGALNFYTVFQPFVSSLSTSYIENGQVKLLPYITFYTYMDLVHSENVTSYLANIRSWGGNYTNVNYINGFLSTEPDVPRPYYYVTTLYIPEGKTSGTSIGSSLSRNQTITAVLESRSIQVSSKIDLAVGASGVAVIAPVIRSGVVTGFVSNSISISRLLSQSVTLSNDQGVVLLDYNDPDVTVMSVLTDGIKLKKDSDQHKYSDVIELLRNARSTSNSTVNIYNRQYVMIYFTNSLPASETKIIPLIVCLFFMLIVEVTLIILFFYRRIVIVRKMQDLTRGRLDILETHRVKLSALLKKSIRSEAKSRSIINSLTDIVIVIDKVGRILQTNQSFDNLFAFNEQEWNGGVKLSSILVDLDPMFFESLVSGSTLTTKASAKSGDDYQVEVKVSNMIGDDGVESKTPTSAVEKNKVELKLNKEEEEEEAYVVLLRRL
ncbi:7-dehydrocholesterol reductase [Acrasis kona]|uniref:7-dehydrocholesterol reductase n=1 Tax=Acrasis kona TaxID=1008807 RepID=A0AAW2ZDS3_9EUKA